jgi:hypothetical protein
MDMDALILKDLGFLSRDPPKKQFLKNNSTKKKNLKNNSRKEKNSNVGKEHYNY